MIKPHFALDGPDRSVRYHDLTDSFMKQRLRVFYRESGDTGGPHLNPSPHPTFHAPKAGNIFFCDASGVAGGGNPLPSGDTLVFVCGLLRKKE